jgi:hypothetical protein
VLGGGAQAGEQQAVQLLRGWQYKQCKQKEGKVGGGGSVEKAVSSTCRGGGGGGGEGRGGWDWGVGLEGGMVSKLRWLAYHISSQRRLQGCPGCR